MHTLSAVRAAVTTQTPQQAQKLQLVLREDALTSSRPVLSTASSSSAPEPSAIFQPCLCPGKACLDIF